MSYRFFFIIIPISIAIKIIAIYFTSFDLFGDEAQYWLWSKSPGLGYYSKPPLLAWLLSAHTYILGNSFVALKFFPLLFYFLVSYAVYLLSFELYKDKKLATITAFSFYLIPSVSVSSFLISTDVVLVFFCTAFLLILLKIREKPNLNNFVILGIFLGLSFLTKYATIYYIFSLILIIIFDNKLRSGFKIKSIKVWVFVTCFIIVFLPNIIWNFQNGWLTLSHTSENAGLDRINFNIIQGFEFLLSQALMLGFILFFSFIFYLKKLNFTFQTKFLLIFSMPAFCIVFIESVLVRSNANWAAVSIVPFFILILHHSFNHSKKIIIYNNTINFIICFILFTLITFSSNLKVFDRINGITSFSKNLKKNHLDEINYLIIEDRLLFSNLSYYLRKSNKTLLTSHNPKSIIKSHFHLTRSLESNFNKKFIFIGNIRSLDYLEKKFSANLKEDLKVNFSNNSIKIYEILF